MKLYTKGNLWEDYAKALESGLGGQMPNVATLYTKENGTKINLMDMAR
jgi:hypothetical protein